MFKINIKKLYQNHIKNFIPMFIVISIGQFISCFIPDRMQNFEGFVTGLIAMGIYIITMKKNKEKDN